MLAVRSLQCSYPFKDEAQTASCEDPVRTAHYTLFNLVIKKSVIL